jgi:hypothetical protein
LQNLKQLLGDEKQQKKVQSEFNEYHRLNRQKKKSPLSTQDVNRMKQLQSSYTAWNKIAKLETSIKKARTSNASSSASTLSSSTQSMAQSTAASTSASSNLSNPKAPAASSSSSQLTGFSSATPSSNSIATKPLIDRLPDIVNHRRHADALSILHSNETSTILSEQTGFDTESSSKVDLESHSDYSAQLKKERSHFAELSQRLSDAGYRSFSHIQQNYLLYHDLVRLNDSGHLNELGLSVISSNGHYALLSQCFEMLLQSVKMTGELEALLDGCDVSDGHNSSILINFSQLFPSYH